jgi:hypothetical protein
MPLGRGGKFPVSNALVIAAHSATTPFFGGRDVQRLLEDILFAIGLIWMAIMQIVSVIQQCDAPEGFGPKTSESFLQFLTLREGVAR